MSKLYKAPNFTKENAAGFAKRAWNKRRAEMAELKAKAIELQDLKESLAFLQTQSPDRVKRLECRMTEIEGKMKGAQADTLAKLAVAHTNLFKSWQTLTGHPNPPAGKRKTVGNLVDINPTPSDEPLQQPSQTDLQPTDPLTDHNPA